jgi:hypothetical protein
MGDTPSSDESPDLAAARKNQLDSASFEDASFSLARNTSSARRESVG